MTPFYDKFDSESQQLYGISDDYLTSEGRIHYDYNGCLPSDDDYADCYKFRRNNNAVL